MIKWAGGELSSDTYFVVVGLGVAEIDPSDQIVGSFVLSVGSFVQTDEAHSVVCSSFF